MSINLLHQTIYYIILLACEANNVPFRCRSSQTGCLGSFGKCDGNMPTAHQRRSECLISWGRSSHQANVNATYLSCHHCDAASQIQRLVTFYMRWNIIFLAIFTISVKIGLKVWMDINVDSIRQKTMINIVIYVKGHLTYCWCVWNTNDMLEFD
jgi:hypothetical protein